MYTPQYDGLETLCARYHERGLVVAGFPSNDFGAQEPGAEKATSGAANTLFKIAERHSEVLLEIAA